jgi:hypothetical protein
MMWYFVAMTRTAEDVLVECADLLQDWYGVSQFGAKEVLAWWRNGEPAFALRGDALRMERSVLVDAQGLNNYNHRLDISLQRQFGLDPEPQYMGQRVHIRNQLMSDGTATVAEVLEAIQSVVNTTFASETGEDVYPHVTLMPNEGSPWNYDDDETPYYDAKKRKFFATPRPDWLATVMAEPEWGEPKVEMIGADFCQLVDVIEASAYHPLTACFEGECDDLSFIVTHSLDFTVRGIDPDEVASFINECGGLLFPSLAVGALPAANFGAVCLVIDPAIILQSMKPYKRKRGNWPVVTYTTDVWTERMSTFLGWAAVRVYEELTGGADGWEYYANMHFWVLGPPVDLDAAPGQIIAKVVKSTKQLRTAIRKRAKYWHRDMTAEEIEDAANLTTVERYPYLEAKVNGIVTVADMTACVYPAERDAEVTAFLNAIGFTGLQVPLDVPYEPSFLDAEVTYAWSWAVHDALVSLQQSYPVELD